MEIKVFCQNCHVEILRADTDTLKTPLVGSMFQVKKDMEWSLFSPHDTGFDLTCPMCDWTFHENGKVRVAVGDDFVFGVPEVIIPGILGFYEESGEVTEVALNKISESIKEEAVVSAILDPTCYKTEAGEHLEGEVLSAAISLNGGFVRYFGQLDAGDGKAHDKLRSHMEHVCLMLNKMSPGDAADLADCLDESQAGRLSRHFHAWVGVKDSIGAEVGGQSEEKTEVPPEISQIQDAVEAAPEKKDEEVEVPKTNKGAWSEAADSDEDSETKGVAPQGTVATEPQAPEDPQKRGGRPKGSKNKGRKYRK